MPGHTDFSDLSKLFDAYRKVFMQGRYFYEFYEDKTLQEQHEAGEQWARSGSPLESADLQYYPKELTCLCEALDTFISEEVERADSQADQSTTDA